MFRRIFCIAICCVSLALTVSAQSEGTTWSAWFFYPGSRQAYLVADDGTVLRHLSDFDRVGGSIISFPPLPSDIMEFPDIAVSNTGRYFVYSQDTELVVYDTVTGDEVLRYGSTTTFDSFTYSWVRRFFNENDTLLAFGFNHSDYQTGEGGWEIVILDLTTGGAVLRLRDTDPAAQAAGLPGFNFVPNVQNFDDGKISFFLFPDGMESGPNYDAWTWSMGSGEVTPNRAFVHHSTDYLPLTGEVIFPAADLRLEQLPCSGECGQFYHSNTLQAYDPNVGLPAPFYHSSTIHFWQVHFVQNGEKIVTQGRSLAEDQIIWYLVGRDGSLVADITDLNIASLASTPEGFIFTQAGSSDIMRLDTRPAIAEPSVFWTSPDGGTPLILWASKPAFTPWRQMAAPQ
jgi:hypothetical protein